MRVLAAMQTRTQSTITIVACQLHPDNEWGIVVEDTIEGGVASLDLCQVLLAEKTQKKKAPKDQEAPEPVVDTQVGKFCGALKTTTVFKDCLVTNFFF